MVERGDDAAQCFRLLYESLTPGTYQYVEEVGLPAVEDESAGTYDATRSPFARGLDALSTRPIRSA